MNQLSELKHYWIKDATVEIQNTRLQEITM